MKPRLVVHSRLVLSAPCLAVLILLLAWTHLPAQMAPDDYRQGTHVFRYLLEKKSGFEYVDGLTLDDDPAESLVIVLGDADALDRIPPKLHEFLNRGGAVLVATDRKVSISPLKDAYGLEVSGQLVHNNSRDQTYRGLSACPFVFGAPHEASELFTGLPKPSNSRQATSIATNLPSYLVTTEPAFSIAGFQRSETAYLPPGCYVPRAEGRTSIRFNDALLVGVALKIDTRDAGRQKKGRLLVLADHSIFINEMMQQTDNGNAAFAIRAASWLNDSGKRKRLLFVEDGIVQKKADIKLQALPNPPVPPIPSADSLIGKADQILGQAEQDRVFDRALLSLVPPPVMFRWLLYLVTAGLVFYGLSRLRKGRHRVDTSTPLLATAVARATPIDNPIERRSRALLASGNLLEPARILSLQFFEAILGPDAVKPTDQVAGRHRLPPFQVKLSGLRGWLLGQRVRRLWRFAHLPNPSPVSTRQFRKLTRQIAALKEAVSRGVLRFSSVTPAPVSR